MKKNSIVLALLFAATGLLPADTVTYTNAVTMNSLQDATLSLNQFNASLGTLTGIYIEFTTALYGTDYAFDNDLTVSKKPSVTLAMDILSFSTAAGLDGTGISPDGSDLSIFSYKLFSLARDDGDSSGQFDTGGTDYGRWIPGTLSSTAGGYVDSSVFAGYIGSGTLLVTINSDISAAIATWTGVEADPDNALPTGEFSAQITYEYAVPEPAAIGLIGLGGIITLTASRIRRRNA